MSDIREAFEAYLRDQPGFTPSELRKNNGEYADAHTAAVWIGWQAALSGAQLGIPYAYTVIDADGGIDHAIAFSGGKEGAEQAKIMCHQHINDAIRMDIDGSEKWTVRPVYSAPPSVAVPEGTESALSFIKQALALPSKPLPDPHAHSHEAYARALHEAFCAIRFKLMHAMDALTATPSPEHIADAGNVVQRDLAAIAVFIDEWADDYEFDTGGEGVYQPSEQEKHLIADAMHGLLDQEEFQRLIAPELFSPPATPSVLENAQARAILDAVNHAKANSAVNRGLGTVSESLVLKYALAMVGEVSGVLDIRGELERRLRTAGEGGAL